MNFSSVCAQLLKLQIDDVILGMHGQASPKRLLKLQDHKTKRTYEVDFVHVTSYLIKL